MGNTSSTDAPKAPIQYGCHILHVQAGSPGEACGLKAYFDLVLSAQGIYLDKEKDEGKLVDILKANLHKPVRLMIYNLKTESLREAAITPSDDWGGAGVAGITIRYCSSESALDTVWHVLEVQPNSPASKAGLKPGEDYIIGTHNALLQDAEDLYNMIAAYEGKNLALFVYNTNSDNTRLVNLIPDKHWGGQGSIGCTFGSGYLHRIPRTSQAMASSDAHHHGSHSRAHGGHDHSHSHSHGHSHDHDDHSHSHAHDDHSHGGAHDGHSHIHAHHEQAPHKEVHKEHKKEHKHMSEEKHKNQHYDEHQVSCDDHSHSHAHDDHSHSHAHDEPAHNHDDHSHSHALDDHSHSHAHDEHSHSHAHDDHSHSDDDHSHSHSDNKEPQRVHSIEELLSPRSPPPVYEEVSIHASGSSTPSVKKRQTPPQSPDINFVQSSFDNMSMLSPIDHPEFQPQPIPPFSPIFAQPPTETEQLPEVSLQEIHLDENE